VHLARDTLRAGPGRVGFPRGRHRVAPSATTITISVGTPPTPAASCTSPSATGGYCLAAANGAVYACGTARPCGSVTAPNSPIVALVATPDGRGYWSAAADGGVFAFGDAHFYGSMGDIPLNAPVVGMAPAADGRGYWLVASDGGIFNYGPAAFAGSIGGQGVTDIVGIASP